jgi:hypothetical protein
MQLTGELLAVGIEAIEASLSGGFFAAGDIVA